jgi:hypothetical protein
VVEMKKIIFILIIFLLSIGIAGATAVSLNVSWQLSSNVTRPGAYSTIYLTVANTGVDVSGIIINPTAGPYLKVVSGSSTEIGDLPATQSQQAAITVKADDNATTTTSYVYLDITYYYGNSQYEKTFYVPITIRGDPKIQIENVNFNSSLEPGSNVLLTFDLVNDGQGGAKDITVSLTQNSNFITLGSSGEFFIKNLDRYGTQELTIPLTVSPDASIGTTTIPIELSYYDSSSSTSFTDTQQIGASIMGNYNFIVTLDSQDVIAPETTGSATIKIANGGNQQASHLVVNVIKSNNFDITPTTIYVGNLNSDDYDSETLSLSANQVSPGLYPVNLNISYDDSFGRTYSQLYPVNIEISSNSAYSLAHPAQTPLSFIIIIVIVAIVLFMIYRKGYLNKLFRRK